MKKSNAQIMLSRLIFMTISVVASSLILFISVKDYSQSFDAIKLLGVVITFQFYSFLDRDINE